MFKNAKLLTWKQVTENKQSEQTKILSWICSTDCCTVLTYESKNLLWIIFVFGNIWMNNSFLLSSAVFVYRDWDSNSYKTIIVFEIIIIQLILFRALVATVDRISNLMKIIIVLESYGLLNLTKVKETLH